MSSPNPFRLLASERVLPADDLEQHLGPPHQPVAVLGWLVLLYGDFEIYLSNRFWSGFWNGDATMRATESNWITYVGTRGQAESGSPQLRCWGPNRVPIEDAQVLCFRSTMFGSD